MVAIDTFLTTLAVIADDCCTASLPVESPPGPHAARARSEGLTVAIFGRVQGFGSERGLYREAQRHLRPALPPLPTRAQWHRPLRHPQAALVLCVLPLGQLWAAHQC